MLNTSFYFLTVNKFSKLKLNIFSSNIQPLKLNPKSGKRKYPRQKIPILTTRHQLLIIGSLNPIVHQLKIPILWDTFLFQTFPFSHKQRRYIIINNLLLTNFINLRQSQIVRKSSTFSG